MRNPKALFITTKTADCSNHVRAWESVYGPCEILTFDHMAIRNDWRFLEVAERILPAVIFYIGACSAPGNPRPETLQGLRKIAPLINFCSDAVDHPWHPVLAKYRTLGCFDLQVSIDGANMAPVDLATLTPVDARLFEGHGPGRNIRCGFSGTVGRWNSRSEIINSLSWFGGLAIRDREGSNRYEDHVGFLRQCRMVLNISFSGTGHAHHIKGRVLEAGWAGCCLLETEGSPIGEWFPEGSWISYRTPNEAAEIIATMDDETIRGCAEKLAAEVRAKYRPDQIYGEILSRVGLTVEV